MKIISVLFIFLGLSAHSQDYSLKKQLPSMTTAFLGGFSEGVSESLQFQYTDFKRVFPKANDQYWDPKISWRNKYKDLDYTKGPRFFGSTTFLVWTTDAYHMTRFARNTMLVTTIALRTNKKKGWKSYIFDMFIHTASYHAGFFASYDILFGGIRKW